MRQIAAWSVAAAGISGIVALRVTTVDLTEGQALIEYWWGWLASIGAIVAGLALASR